MRVAFSVFGGGHWTGGINYLENLLSAISEQSDCAVHPVLFVGADADPGVIARLSPYLPEPVVISSVWSSGRAIRLARLACAFGLQRDYLAERAYRKAGIELVFQHGAWYGYWFPIPTLGWIADFQHRRLPKMFSYIRFLWREVGYRAWARCATRILVSSQDARHDCEHYYPRSKGRIEVLPFAAKTGPPAGPAELATIRRIYNLPEKFYFLPNQLWKHKNHLRVIEALALVKAHGRRVFVVASGNPSDLRHPDFPKNVLQQIIERDITDHFRFLGMIPYAHVLALMRLTAAVVNPSLSEGWSTTVEEAKAIGTPLILSRLPIHREQVGDAAVYFDPEDSVDIARVLEGQWAELTPGPRPAAEAQAKALHDARRRDFAMAFEAIARRTIGGTGSA